MAADSQKRHVPASLLPLPDGRRVGRAAAILHASEDGEKEREGRGQLGSVCVQ